MSTPKPAIGLVHGAWEVHCGTADRMLCVDPTAEQHRPGVHAHAHVESQASYA